MSTNRHRGIVQFHRELEMICWRCCCPVDRNSSKDRKLNLFICLVFKLMPLNFYIRSHSQIRSAIWIWICLFFKNFLEEMSSFCGATDTSVLDFWWRLPRVSKPGWIPRLHALSPACHEFLRFPSGATWQPVAFPTCYICGRGTSESVICNCEPCNLQGASVEWPSELLWSKSVVKWSTQTCVHYQYLLHLSILKRSVSPNTRSIVYASNYYIGNTALLLSLLNSCWFYSPFFPFSWALPTEGVVCVIYCKVEV